MISFFKEYAYTLLLVSIFVLFLEMVIRKNAFKKYIMLFISILLITSFIKPLINLEKEEELSKQVTDVYNKITKDNTKSKTEEIDIDKIVRNQNENLVKEAIEKIKKDIEDKCIEYNIKYKSVIISTENNTNVSEIIIRIKNTYKNNENIKMLLKYISDTYSVDEKIIKIEEEL